MAVDNARPALTITVDNGFAGFSCIALSSINRVRTDNISETEPQLGRRTFYEGTDVLSRSSLYHAAANELDRFCTLQYYKLLLFLFFYFLFLSSVAEPERVPRTWRRPVTKLYIVKQLKGK